LNPLPGTDVIKHFGVAFEELFSRVFHSGKQVHPFLIFQVKGAQPETLIEGEGEVQLTSSFVKKKSIFLV
jgi:hypothetical protein